VPDVFNPECDSRQVLDLIADKWTALVIYDLARGGKRYSELQRDIGGISQKMLTQSLRKLETDGIVARTVYPVVPPKVRYDLTPLGETLTDPLSAICRWAERHVPELQALRGGPLATTRTRAISGSRRSPARSSARGAQP
jgi:DNA-binding HxlR family transcriptional regulator